MRPYKGAKWVYLQMPDGWWICSLVPGPQSVLFAREWSRMSHAEKTKKRRAELVDLALKRLEDLRFDIAVKTFDRILGTHHISIDAAMEMLDRYVDEAGNPSTLP